MYRAPLFFWRITGHSEIDLATGRRSVSGLPSSDTRQQRYATQRYASLTQTGDSDTLPSVIRLFGPNQASFQPNRNLRTRRLYL